MLTAVTYCVTAAANDEYVILLTSLATLMIISRCSMRFEYVGRRRIPRELARSPISPPLPSPDAGLGDAESATDDYAPVSRPPAGFRHFREAPLDDYRRRRRVPVAAAMPR